MTETFLLVDFENVSRLDFAHLPERWAIWVFMGNHQKTIPADLVSEAQPLGSRVRWIAIEGVGHNNLDFHLACYLGVLATQHPGAEFVVLTRDKGFDALLKHLTRNGIPCRRIDEFAQIAQPKAVSESGQFTRVYQVLAKTEKKSRPRRRKTLEQAVASVFQKKLSAVAVQEIVELFFAKKLISETNNALTYDF